jgi:proteasome lid subunit RPN8/RPN11/molybdopterin converting factor small subunit
MLLLPRSARQEIESQASSAYPRESCGLVLGRRDGEAGRAALVVAGANLSGAPDRYELDPADFVRADRLARERGEEILGFWHSHPDHPARPSETDRAQAWEGWCYLIAAVTRAGPGDLRAWRLQDQRFQEEEIRPMTTASLRIPAPLRSFTGGADELEVSGGSLRECLRDAGVQHAELLARVLDSHGELRPFVRLFLGERDARALGGLDARVQDGDVLSIVPAVAGGRP